MINATADRMPGNDASPSLIGLPGLRMRDCTQINEPAKISFWDLSLFGIVKYHFKL